ncbi:MAG: hypothetical protein AAFO84_17235 [Cyanobacteria bacterium J06598_1]
MSTTQQSISPVMAIWRQSLSKLLDFYDRKRGSLRSFFPKIFIFCVFLNIACYWLAILTTHPEEFAGAERLEYLLMQFPVGFLGAIFDSLSFFITVWIARRALNTKTLAHYVSYLSVDVLIAIAATGWVLMVFSVSGWLVSQLLVHMTPSADTVSLAQSSIKYESRATAALRDPLGRDNIKNIYFGVIMGFSAMIPTLTHLYLSARAVGVHTVKVARKRRSRQR